jgi:hypothetical protein
MPEEDFITYINRLRDTINEMPPVPLPEFGEGMSAILNALARSATFAPMEKGSRIRVESVIIPSQTGYEITFSGEKLDESDRDVYLKAIQLYQGIDPGTPCLVSLRAFLKGIERPYGKSEREWLVASLKRLSDVRLQIKIQTSHIKGTYGGGILTFLAVAAKENESEGVISFSIPPQFIDVFMRTKDYTKISMRKRLALKGPGSQRAKWLHSILYSHKGPFCRKLKKLYEESNASGVLRNFKVSIKQGLNLLKKNGDIVDWKITSNKTGEDIVYAWKNKEEMDPQIKINF